MKYFNLIEKIIFAILKGFVIAIFLPLIILLALLHYSRIVYIRLFRSKKLEIIDPVFGRMFFIYDDENPYWETESVFFATTKSQITFLVNASKNGSTKKQKDFYEDIETNYQAYFETTWFPFIQSQIDNEWLQNKRVSENDWKNSFAVESITIPRFRGKKYEWDITFVTTFDEHYFTVEMKGWNPDNLLIDG